MGKKGYNAKARRNPETFVDNSAVKDIKIELETGGTGYDEANALVLPSQKRTTKIKVENRQNIKILSKKQRKHLQSIVDKKKKKEGRADLLEQLATVQIKDSELQQYTSISQAQTIGLKKLTEYLEKKKEKDQLDEQDGERGARRISTIKGSAKRKLLVEEEEKTNAKRRDPNFINVSDSDSDSSSAEELEDDKPENIQIEKQPEHTVKLQTSIEDVQPAKEKVHETSTSNKAKTKQKQKDINPKSDLQLMHKTVYVPVNRSPQVQATRLKLPILAEEQQVMEAINENSIVIVAGETGSGKTTQIPQFLYEAGYAQNNKIIGITEPRRVAAIAMSKRVAHEMNLTNEEVSYLIRFEGNVTPNTRIKFMTDGVLLKEIEYDFMLLNYSVIILDEAHERSAYTDILVGLLSRIVPLRYKRGNPLKLIVMSATLRVEDFTSNANLFKSPPPVLKVESRQFPVTKHFQKHTPSNYVEEAYRKTVKIHARLPEGGILIFVTGQQEVNQLVRKLRRTFPYNEQLVTHKKAKASESTEATESKLKTTDNDNDEEFDMIRAIRNVRKSKKKFLEQISLPKVNLDDYKMPGDDTESDMHDTVGREDFTGAEETDAENDADDDDLDADDIITGGVELPTTKQPLWVLPLYSLLSSEQQNRIFESPPEGARLCIVSTNVAETSLTIPNIKYVVDSGRQKTRLYDKITGVSSFVVTFTSKASADQRAGRAGRVSAGHCYRLYSSAVFNDVFEDFSVPDIQKKPVDDLMLQMRCMGIDRVVNFPFPSPPDKEQLLSAEKCLTILGALERVEPRDGKELPPIVTKLGHVISRFPVAPRFGKMLALSHQQNLLPYTVCLVAALSVQEILMEVGVDRGTDIAPTANKWQKKRQNWAGTGNYKLLGDPMVLMRAVGAAEYTGAQGKLATFCADNGLRLKAMTEVRKLRRQLTNEINLHISDVDICVDPEMAPPNDAQALFLRQILLAGMGDRVAHKVPLEDVSDKEEKRRLKYAYNCLDMEEPAFMHTSSVLKQSLPEWIVYQEAYELQNGDSTKMFLRGITAIEPEWLLLYVPLLCNIRQERDDPPPRFNATDGKIYCFVDATFGKAAWELPLAEIAMPFSEKACSYFGMFLLDGLVCPKLADYKGKLKSTPSSLIKSWSNLNENIVRFKRALINNKIHTRQSLFTQWKKDPNFLLTEYQNMLFDVAISELTPFWPPVTHTTK